MKFGPRYNFPDLSFLMDYIESITRTSDTKNNQAIYSTFLEEQTHYDLTVFICSFYYCLF